MKAAVLERNAPIETSPLRELEVPAPEPGPGEILIRVSCCGICRTDLHVIEGDLPAHRLPLIPGHQIVGTVEEAGAGATRFSPGERVGAGWLRNACGACKYCRQGRENLCTSQKFTGYDEHGGLAGYCVVPEAYAYPIPAYLSDTQAAPLLCAGIIGYRAFARTGVARGGALGLFGFGSSAHLVAQIARAQGIRFHVITRDPRHQELGRSLGAESAGANAGSLTEKLDAAILFAPAGELVPQALAALDRGGVFVNAGIHCTAIPPLDYRSHLFFEKDVRSTTANTRQDGLELLKLAERIELAPVTRTYAFASVNEALQDLKHDRFHGSAVIDLT